MSIEEASWELRSASRQDFKRFSEARAMSERIAEWLATPEGTVAHNPSWGHNLSRYKHNPINETLEILIEIALSRKLPVDIEDLVLRGVHVEALDIDLCRITVIHQFGADTQTTNL